MDPSPDDAYVDDDAAMRCRPSYLAFRRCWLMDDPVWRQAFDAGDENDMDDIESRAEDDILADYKESIAE